MSGNHRQRCLILEDNDDRTNAANNGDSSNYRCNKRPRLTNAGGGAEPPPLPKKKNENFELRRLCASEARRTNDEIHSSIDLCPVTVALMDTPQFQRLRGLRQLGTAEYVYVNANHNRFEHSIGVSHLAERLCRRVRDRQPGLPCTAKDVLCVKLAGLLHDIGHGPYSHDYEQFVKGRGCDGHAVPDLPSGWCHEFTSLDMIDAALAHLGLAIDLDRLDDPLKQVGDGVDALSMRVFDTTTMIAAEDDDDTQEDRSEMVLTSRDFVFVMECICGGPIDRVKRKFFAIGCDGDGEYFEKQTMMIGRTEAEKEWMYDIVSNRHSGLDVDKIDYYARDERRAFRAAGEIDKLMIEEAVVAWADCTNVENDGGSGCPRCHEKRAAGAATSSTNGSTGTHDVKSKHAGQHLMICYPFKMVNACMEFFKKRFYLHSNIYTHKARQAAAYMISDVLTLADPYFKIPTAPMGSSGGGGRDDNAAVSIGEKQWTELPLSRAMLDVDAYLRMRDSIVDQIANTTCDGLRPARDLIHRLYRRDLYKCVSVQHVNTKDRSAVSVWKDKSKKDIAEEMLSIAGSRGGVLLGGDDFIVEKCSIHHGCKDRNPLNRMRFLSKEFMEELAKDDVSGLPVAVQVPEYTYEAQLPRSLQENSIRVYSRHRDKNEIIHRVFSEWFDSVTGKGGPTATGTKSPALTPIIAAEGNVSRDGAAHSPLAPVMLSQLEDQDDRDVTESPTGPVITKERRVTLTPNVMEN